MDLANCASEWQMVMCGDIPLRDAKRLAACCDMNRPSNKPTASPVELDRPDVTAAINGNAPGVDYEMGTCTNLTYAHVPAFSRFKNTTRVRIAPWRAARPDRGYGCADAGAHAAAAGWGRRVRKGAPMPLCGG